MCLVIIDFITLDLFIIVLFSHLRKAWIKYKTPILLYSFEIPLCNEPASAD